VLSSTWAQNGKSSGPTTTTAGHSRSFLWSASDPSKQTDPDVPRSCGMVDGNKVGALIVP
jgi:hypothetical protein